VTTTLERLGTAASSGARCLFLSPHLDDAVLSCGALMRSLAPRSEIHVVTVFTEITDSAGTPTRPRSSPRAATRTARSSTGWG
jgi:hypothetical protein